MAETMADAIHAAGVTIRLGAYTALEQASFTLAPGGTLAVVGPNGAGKSTLIQALLGLIPLADGTLMVFGEAPGRQPALSTGYVPQAKSFDRTFPALTCELIASGLRRSWPGRLAPAEHARVEESLTLVGARHLSHQPLKHLSGGELQRVYLARALIRRPRLLLLDEPATGIDAVGEDDMYAYIERYQRESGATVCMVTHDWLVAQHHATQVLLLNRRVIACGPPDAALADDNLRQAFGHAGHRHAQPAGGRDA
jgi:zinc transport system ATP-binding protein